MPNEQEDPTIDLMDSTTTQTAGEGLRERKKLATKQALAFAAMQLAVERGLENVRVQDITDAVNVPAGPSPTTSPAKKKRSPR